MQDTADRLQTAMKANRKPLRIIAESRQIRLEAGPTVPAGNVVMATEMGNAQQILETLLLRESPVLALFNSEELDAISRTSTVQTIKPGEVFMNQGECSSSMYVILSGSVIMSIDFSGSNDMNQAVRVDSVSGVVGEAGMLTGQRREAFGSGGSDGCALLELTITQVRSLSLKRFALRAKLIALMAKAKKNKIASLMRISNLHPAGANSVVSDADRKDKDTLSTRAEGPSHMGKKFSVAVRARTAVHNLSVKEDTALQAVLSKADFWITENAGIQEEYESRPLIAFVEQYPLAKRMYIAGMGVGLLHKAAWTGNKLICAQLLKCGCSIDLQDAQHKNVLHHVVEGSQWGNNDHFETLRMFLERGVALIRDCDGNSPADISKRDDISLLLVMHLRDSQLAQCSLPACSRKPMILCSSCRLVKYCCMDHLQDHFQSHFQHCLRASPASQTVQLSRLAVEKIKDSLRKVNNISLQKDWQVRKARGLSMDEFVSRQKQRLFFAIWDRYRWIVRAQLSILYTKAMDRTDAAIISSVEAQAESRQQSFVLAETRDDVSLPDFCQMLKKDLQILCLREFGSVRKKPLKLLFRGF